MGSEWVKVGWECVGVCMWRWGWECEMLLLMLLFSLVVVVVAAAAAAAVLLLLLFASGVLVSGATVAPVNTAAEHEDHL